MLASRSQTAAELVAQQHRRRAAPLMRAMIADGYGIDDIMVRLKADGLGAVDRDHVKHAVLSGVVS